VKIELFYIPGCEKCATARDDLKATAEQVIPGIIVLTLPAVAIDGEIVFSSLPTSGQLRRELAKRKRS